VWARALRIRPSEAARPTTGSTKKGRSAQYKAFDGPATRYYFVPVGKDGMPIIVDTGSGPRGSK